MAASRAIDFKEQGNKAFQAGDFKEAEACYTRAYASTSTLIVLEQSLIAIN